MTIPKKGTAIKKSGGKTFYYAGSTLYPSKARLTALELAERGIKVLVTVRKNVGSLLWTDKKTYLDLSEPLAGRYRNPQEQADVSVITKGIKAPFVHVQRSTLGGENRASILIRVSLDSKSIWYNNIFQNSRYMQFYLGHDNVLEQFAKSYEISKKFRITKVSNTADAIIKINNYISDISKNNNPVNMTKALSMRSRYNEDLDAGHKDAAEYWRGQASAYFTGNPLVNVSECPKCHRKLGQKHKIITAKPTVETMERWARAGTAKATDGCRVEEDGVCEHGHSSWMRVLGYI